MAVTQYVGARYVPVFADPLDWDSERTYEPLTIVYYQGNSYTSRQYVPTGIDISNDEYWALTGNYNAQIEQYRQEVAAFDGRITSAQEAAEGAQSAAEAAQGTADAVTSTVEGITPFDVTPTENSQKGVTSGGVFTAIETLSSEVDTELDGFRDEVDGGIESFKSETEQSISEFQSKVSGDIESFKTEVDGSIANLTKNFKLGNTIMPAIIGTDFVPNTSTGSGQQYSCVCAHNGTLFGFFPYNNSDDSGVVRRYSLSNNTITTASTISMGHANSAAYIESANQIWLLWGYSTPDVTEDHTLTILSANGSSVSSTRQTTHHFHGISYDHQTGIVYGVTGWDYSAGTIDLYTIDTSTFAETFVATVDFSIMSSSNYYGDNTLQDIAVDNGVLYMSTYDGMLGTGTIVNGSFKLDTCYTMSQIDLYGTYYLNETEGMEFDEEGHLICAFTFNCMNAGVFGATCLIGGPTDIVFHAIYGNSRTYSLANSNLTKFAVSATNLRSLSETIVRVRDGTSGMQVQVASGETFTDPAFGANYLSFSCTLSIRGHYITPPLYLNAPVVSIYCPSGAELEIVDGEVLEFAISCAPYYLTQFSLNIAGTYNNTTSKRDIQLANTKAPFTVGNIGSNTITFAEEERANVTANTIYIGAAYKINGVSNNG